MPVINCYGPAMAPPRSTLMAPLGSLRPFPWLRHGSPRWALFYPDPRPSASLQLPGIYAMRARAVIPQVASNALEETTIAFGLSWAKGIAGLNTDGLSTAR